MNLDELKQIAGFQEHWMIVGGPIDRLLVAKLIAACRKVKGTPETAPAELGAINALAETIEDFRKLSNKGSAAGGMVGLLKPLKRNRPKEKDPTPTNKHEN